MTYQEFINKSSESDLGSALKKAVEDYTRTSDYKFMQDAEAYYDSENPNMSNATLQVEFDTGKTVTITPVVEMFSNYLQRIVDQLTNRLWFYPVKITSEAAALKDDTPSWLEDLPIDMATYACLHGVSYGFWNFDELQMFKATEYFPLKDERTSDTLAGIRFWGTDKKRYIQFYELDGMTEFLVINNGVEVYQEKTSYIVNQHGENIIGTETPINFPIVEMQVNLRKKSELTKAIRSKIDAYDIINTVYVDEFVKTKGIHWKITGFGGESDTLAGIKDLINKLGIIATPDEDTNIETATVNIPYEAKAELLEAIETAIYRDAQLMNLQSIIMGNVTATAIAASSTAEDNKVSRMEKYAKRFVRQILELQGINDGEINFTQKVLLNTTEQMQQLSMAHSMGVPTEALISLMPPLQGQTERILNMYKTHVLGMDIESREPNYDYRS